MGGHLFFTEIPVLNGLALEVCIKTLVFSVIFISFVNFSVFVGNCPIRDKGCDEGQLLFTGCRQPHSLHQNQDQRVQRGRVYYPSCRGGGHCRLGRQNFFHPCIFSYSEGNPNKVYLFLFPAPGIYSSTEMLDFGTLRSQGNMNVASAVQTYSIVPKYVAETKTHTSSPPL